MLLRGAGICCVQPVPTAFLASLFEFSLITKDFLASFRKNLWYVSPDQFY